LIFGVFWRRGRRLVLSGSHRQPVERKVNSIQYVAVYRPRPCAARLSSATVARRFLHNVLSAIARARHFADLPRNDHGRPRVALPWLLRATSRFEKSGEGHASPRSASREPEQRTRIRFPILRHYLQVKRLPAHGAAEESATFQRLCRFDLCTALPTNSGPHSPNGPFLSRPVD
jgi:hypothetical protein